MLCGSSADRSTVEFVEPPAGSMPGERVVVEGWVMPEPATTNQVKKKKILEEGTAQLKARADGSLCR